MIVISKKTPDETKKESESKEPEINEAELTPWQKANLSYLKEKGDQPSWSPSIIDGSPDTMTEEIVEEEASDETKTDDVEMEESKGEPTNGSFADRLPKIKSQRDLLLHRRLIFLIVLFTIPLLFTLYYVSPLSKLAKVTVSGNNKVATAEILKDTNFRLQENLWTQFFQRGKNEEKLTAEQPRIKSTSLSIENINHFHLTVTEYQEVALLAKGDTYSPILENGQVMEETLKKPTQDLPILENFTSEKKILSVLKKYRKLSQEIRSGISQINYAPTKSNDELLNLYMNDGNQVIVNISNLTKQMQYYPQVAKDMKEKGIVDMEVGIFTYAYPKEEKKTTESSEPQESENQ